MKFIDEGFIELKAGRGGDGAISFRREYKVPFGGPNGGDGGDGGSIYFVGHKGSNTLLNVTAVNRIIGNDGQNGKSKNMTGANGEDIYIKVPIGTIVFNDNKVVVDVLDESEYIVAKGGKGGRGNARFKTSINKAPRIADNGLPGENYIARLELKILADIGFVGLPSAGKSTILSVISNARPKIGDYDFTTLAPQLGLMKINNENSLVVADLPGLIQGAHEGKGLGHIFLRHIERCRVIAHIIDFGSSKYDQVEAYETINNELKLHMLQLEERSQIVVANKSDLPDFDENLKRFKIVYPNIDIVEISAITQKNIKELKNKLWNIFQVSNQIIKKVPEDEVTISFDEDIQVKKINDKTFNVFGNTVKQIVDLIPLNSHENFLRFNYRLKKIGVWELLKRQNVKEGDTVRIFDYSFNWGNENE